ncbi:MAG: ATP-dependent Clp protease adaptor ClpS [Prevotellaceae bacterium]|nr:ATP-dependent Clp protease adaptor ClpS [Candidatus Colivivens caballi]
MPSTQTKGQRQTGFKLKEPSRYNVIMHNDDKTTMDFVVMVLQRIFHKSADDAEIVMLKIHNEGAAVVGTYYKDIAETKVRLTHSLARQNGFPLLLTIEEDQ